MATIVCAHNPMTGPRHLGHYGSTMGSWQDLIDGGDELFLIIDDLIADLLNPRRRHELQSYSFATAAEFIAMGLPSDSYHLALTSMIPEVHEAMFFTGQFLELPYCNTLYDESFAGLLATHDRLSLELPRQSSTTEFIYPQLALATLILGVRADSYQGGEEMLGYLAPLQAISEGLGIDAPKMRPGRTTFVLGVDGNHMGSENAVYLSSPEENLRRNVEEAANANVLRSWADALGEDLSRGADLDVADARGILMAKLLETLARFRNNKVSNQDIARRLEAGSLEARSRLRDFLIGMKEKHSIPGFARG